MESADFLVIGSGLAGLVFALEVADYGSVVVVTKTDPEEGNTVYAQGGIASVMSPLDSFESHISDTIRAGAGLCNNSVVESVVRDGPGLIRYLLDLGVQFDKQEPTDEFELGREGGHSTRRILHTKDATGREIHRVLLERVRAHPHIRVLPHHIAVDLIHSGENGGRRLIGAYVLDKLSGVIRTFGARVTMIATGGVGKVYLYTSNPDVATGDGVAIAYRAGAKIANMEFIQFHPTCLYHPRAKSFLITEAMRGEGAKLRRLNGEEFMHQYHPMKELAPRDIVARAIDEQLKRTGDDYVMLDITHRDAEFVRSRFPTIYATALEFGIDISSEPIPVVPAAHYCCGGILSDEWGRTSINRLYVAGEAACTGLHGANRLASNSLLEALVFAHRAALDARNHLSELSAPRSAPEWDYVNSVESAEEVIVSHMWDEARRLMWNLVGIVRSDNRLRLARRRVRHLREDVRDYYWKYKVTADLLELRNILIVADIIIESASRRRESRGLHYNMDCPYCLESETPLDTVVELLR